MSASEALSTTPTSLTLAGVPAGAEALVLAELLTGKHLAQKPRAIIHIAASDRSLDTLAQNLTFFAPDVEVLRFPAWDCMPYDRASPLPSLMAERMRTLSTLAGNPSATRIVLTTASAMTQKLPPREAMKGASVSLARGQRINRDELVAALLAQGYRRNGKAMEPGEFALRGSIVDLVAPGMSEGVRIDLFGDDIETIRAYDPLTQLTISSPIRGEAGRGAHLGITPAMEQASPPPNLPPNGGGIILHPMSEVLLSDATVSRFRESYRELFGAVAKDDPLYEAVSAGHAWPGMEHWLPLFYERTDTLADYCEGALITRDYESETALTERFESVADYYLARREAQSNRSAKNSFGAGSVYHPVPPERAFLDAAAWHRLLDARSSVLFSPFVAAAGEAVTVGFRPVIRFAPAGDGRTPFDELKERIDAAAASGEAAVLACYSTGSRERLQTLLMERGFHCLRIDAWREVKDVKGKSLGLALLPLENGFDTGKVVIFSEQDVLGERIARARPKKKKSDIFMAEAANFGEGELVVHKEHGIGRFEGLVTLTVSGAAHDCLKLIYEGDDKLFLPVENIEMVSRFGMEDEGVKLDKLGGASWQSRKARLKERITIAAEALLKTAAERLLRKGTIIEAETGGYEEFCARFPYVETDDQASAITDVLEDLHSGRSMDRLICGDVGFGKTEVALRAAFAASHASAGKLQVALICPTTLLARQHFRNFSQRFSGFPITVRQLSRIVPAREQKATREGLADGSVDIVIGTHALLSKQVAFRNFGLLIVDEEQHFGVAQKEKLKEMKAGVHVLTLSATPIPRTLQMALTGVRDLSLITTPPIDRLAVRSFVMPMDPVVMREAMLREMHRGGKCFVVTPRIKDMAELKTQLAQLVPEAKFAIAHGQMAASELDTVMNDFYDGKYDALLSTAIVESGLDIPTANTMIIHNAHLFGLSQLYQLRGRVGRGKTRAYAYFMLPHHRQLSKNATRRLEVMQTLDTLGAGFTLASHDMDIRGFGNLVGEEQSGHIREVGIELYQQMLEDAVAALKSKSAAEPDQSQAARQDWSPSINLGLSVLIPEEYVGDLQLRLGLYRRVAEMSEDADIDSFAAELTDRFGDMPEEVRHLIAVLGIKLLCKKAGIERIDTGPKGAVITFRDNRFAAPEKLLAYIDKHARTLKARPDNKIVLTHEWKNTEDKLASVKRLAAEIAQLATPPISP